MLATAIFRALFGIETAQQFIALLWCDFRTVQKPRVEVTAILVGKDIVVHHTEVLWCHALQVGNASLQFCETPTQVSGTAAQDCRHDGRKEH